MAKSSDELEIYHQPDWHPSLTNMIGPIKGQYGIVTETGTIKLVTSNEDVANIEIGKGTFASTERGPTRVLSAESSLIFI